MIITIALGVLSGNIGLSTAYAQDEGGSTSRTEAVRQRDAGPRTERDPKQAQLALRMATFGLRLTQAQQKFREGRLFDAQKRLDLCPPGPIRWEDISHTSGFGSELGLQF